MKLKSVTLKNFKRFTDTTIQDIPETVKLVIIAGPNGSGKSSFFEALNVWSRAPHYGVNWNADYYVKGEMEPGSSWNNSVQVSPHGDAAIDFKKAVYIRSAYRNDAEFHNPRLEKQPSVLDENRLQRLIENDATVRSNYQRLAGQALQDAFELGDDSSTLGEFRSRTIGEIRAATQRLFPDLVLNSLGNPIENGTFKFDKGQAKSFLYMNLSGGEKSAFDLLLDVIVKRREYDNTIFCIDEPEAHMNSRLQGALLQELYDALGDKSQLWLATHSAGMMRRSRDIEREKPGTVAFLDFGGRDFDQPQIITPEKPSRLFWSKVLEVAFDDFAELIAPREVVICEGSRIGEGGASENVDAKVYEEVFSDEFPDCRFIPAGNSNQVESDRLALVAAMQSLVKGTTVRRLIDRDDLSDTEVGEKRKAGVSVLHRRNIECYLFSDEIIKLLCASRGREDLADALVSEKADLMADASANRGRPTDDVKSSAGPIMVRLKKDLSLTQSGGTVKQFMRITLAPLIKPDTATYKELKSVVFSPKDGQL